jgi:hypothetical protein
MRKLNLTKICGIVGIVLGEIYMVFTVLAPAKSGIAVPVDHQIWRLVILSIFFGVFGGLVGTGVGLLLSSLIRRR